MAWQEKQNERYRDYTKEIREKEAKILANRAMRARIRAEHRAKGLCVRCQDKALPNRSLCKKHNKIELARSRRYKAKNKAARTKLGLCWYCPKDEIREAMPGTHVCGVCSEKKVDRALEKRKQFKAEGRCYCGAVIDIFHKDGRPYGYCSSCAEISRRSATKYYRKMVKQSKNKVFTNNLR